MKVWNLVQDDFPFQTVDFRVNQPVHFPVPSLSTLKELAFQVVFFAPAETQGTKKGFQLPLFTGGFFPMSNGLTSQHFFERFGSLEDQFRLRSSERTILF